MIRLVNLSDRSWSAVSKSGILSRLSRRTAMRNLVGRKGMAIVGEHLEIQFREEPIRGIGGDHVHLTLFESVVEKSEVHTDRGAGKRRW
jgi:hypothetical protein